MLAESPYAVFTRVVTHPPDFGVTDQLSEFFEEESSSGTSSSTSSLSRSSSSSSPVVCCCNQEPIQFEVAGFPDAGLCADADDYNGVYLLITQLLESNMFEPPGANRICQFAGNSVCKSDSPFLGGGLAGGFEWSFLSKATADGGVLVNARLATNDGPSIVWSKEVANCDELDVTFTSADLCHACTWAGAPPVFLRCLCSDPAPGNELPPALADVVIHATCETEEDLLESSGSSASESSQSVSSPSSSRSSQSASSRSASSQSFSSSSSSTSTSSQSGSSSSSSSSSPSTSSSAPGCQCCDPDVPLSETVYVTIHNLLGSGPCFEPCEDVISPMGVEPCFELTRVDQCTWQGQATQNATCYPDSTVRLTLACNGTSVTMRFTWILDVGDIAVWEKVIPAQYLNCSQCQDHELDPVQAASGCGVSASWVVVNFGHAAGCCEFCPDQYQITIEGVSENDVGGNCEDVDCQQLNGTYLVDFVQRGSSPTGSCTDGIEDWCEYSTPLDLRCTDARFGFCSLHLFLKTTGMCGTKLRVELRADVHPTDDCNLNDVRQGWQIDLDGTIQPAVDCFNIDVTLGLSNLCLDANWNCTADPITIHVEIPGAEGRTALTRLTPMGVPGRRYGI